MYELLFPGNEERFNISIDKIYENDKWTTVYRAFFEDKDNPEKTTSCSWTDDEVTALQDLIDLMEEHDLTKSERLDYEESLEYHKALAGI